MNINLLSVATRRVFRTLAVNDFRKKSPSKMFDMLRNTPLTTQLYMCY